MDYGKYYQLAGVNAGPAPAHVEHGMDTYVIGGLEEPDALRWFASDVIPAVREAVAKAR
jgi:hypothetical protein